MIIFLKLFLAHLLGDFILQPEGWIIEKTVKRHKSLKLYLHALIHGSLALILVGESAFWPFALGILVTHFIIDWVKVTFQSMHTQKIWFFLDQVLHLLILVAITLWETGQGLDLSYFLQERILVLTTAIVFITLPTSIIIRILISGWTPDSSENSLQNAGKYIGMLERLFVFIFILYDHWEAIGFLLAAKSVFRFGNLKESRERKLTEYVLIGTMLSFGIAMLAGILTKQFW